jgi:hypothetical protein
MARFFLLFGVLAWCTLSIATAAESDFRIKGLRETRSTDLIHVGNAWVKDPKRLQVTLRVAADTPADTIHVHAYFFDKDGSKVSEVNAPNAVWTQTGRGIGEVGLPPTLEKNKDIEIYFALTQELDAKKWKSVVIVFGNDTAVAARSFPASALTALDFPEKGKMLKDQN